MTAPFGTAIGAARRPWRVLASLARRSERDDVFEKPADRACEAKCQAARLNHAGQGFAIGGRRGAIANLCSRLSPESIEPDDHGAV